MELRDYGRGLRRHWLAIVMMILVGVAVAFLWAKLQTPVYEADATGIAKSKQTTSDQAQNLVQVGDPAAQSQIPSILEIATWRDVAQYAIKDLKLNTTPEQIVNQVAVTNPQGTTIVQVVAQASSPLAARALAESWLRGMVQTIDHVYGTNDKAGSAPVNIVTGDSASLPTDPLFPNLKMSLLVGAIIGLGFGVAFALMRTASDRRIRAADDVEKKTGVSVVGAIPLSAKGEAETRLFDPEAGRDGPGFAVAEAMRTLRTNLRFMDVDNPPRTIVVTSPLPGEGKSTIAANLALTIAASGQKVVLVDGDLRRSTVAQTMGLSASAGLSDILAGRADLADVLQRAPQSDNLFVLAAGSVPPNPSEVLGSARMKSLLDDLAEHCTVIVDAPPLIPVTDGAVLTHQADGAFVVVSVGKTTYDLLDKALDTLEKARGRALGVVLNKVPLKGADASPYSYEYRRQYGEVAVPADADPVDVAVEQSSAEGSSVLPTVEVPIVGAVDSAAVPPKKSTGRVRGASKSDVSSDELPPIPLTEPEDDDEIDDAMSEFDAVLATDATTAPGHDSSTTPRRHRARRS